MMAEQSRPAQYGAASLVGLTLKEAASLIKSWNFVEAGLGTAALNAWYSMPERAAKNGFTPCVDDAWQRAFDPYLEETAGKVVCVVGHFPTASQTLSRAADLRILERNTRSGDYPDSACEYLLPTSDYVFISRSALVNKTLPRLLELSRNAKTVVLGPSATLSPALLDFGVDDLIGFVPDQERQLLNVLGGDQAAVFESGHRVTLPR